MKITAPKPWVSMVFLLVAVVALRPAARSVDHRPYSGPEMLTYEELLALSQDVEFPADLQEKLTRITTTPFVSNRKDHQNGHPRVPEITGLGPSLRVVFWNIERGVMLDDIMLLFTDKKRFMEKVKKSRQDEQPTESTEATGKASSKDQVERRKGVKLGPKAGSENPYAQIDLNKLAEEVDVLQSADVIVLNEVDWGMPRSNYREVIVELGDALRMNWAYGVEFIEIDPVVLGTEQFKEIEDEEARKELLALTKVDKDRLRALHGTAILSRYPIRSATLKPFETRAYDWYGKEKGIRIGSTFIGSPMAREMRRGGRTVLTVDLDVPHLPEERLTVVSPHLENRTKPKNRQKQLQEVLDRIRHIKNPVIVAGDLNTTGGDSESFRLEKHLYKKYTEADTWVNMGVKYATGVGLGYDVFRWGFKFTKNVSDPTIASVPFVAPNKERNFFKKLEQFRFEDGTSFDFRGDQSRTVDGRGGTLGNSNQRASKGFVHTYEFVISLGVIGRYKLDWVFVKSYLEDPRDSVTGPYRITPHFARTMPRVNFALLEHPLSDHNPMTVDLPFGEPKLAIDDTAASR